LQLAEEDVLDASAAFMPMPGGMEWSRDKKSVKLTKLWLGHIAMTPEPAYETARVLAVRNNVGGEPGRLETPNLDIVKAWRLEERYDRMVR
jgi:phage head maturation protease